MKANEAPEKLYILPTSFEVGENFYSILTNKSEGDIEYVRTDAFIEKAYDWLSDNLQTIVDVDSPSKYYVESIPVLGSITQTEFLSKFRKEIKYLLD